MSMSANMVNAELILHTDNTVIKHKPDKPTPNI